MIVENQVVRKAAVLASVLIALVVVLYLYLQTPAQQLRSFQQRVGVIETLPKEQQTEAVKQLLLAIDQQLTKDSQQIDIARLGLDLSKRSHAYQDHRLSYFEYIDKQLLLTPEERVEYIQLVYQANGLTKPLEKLIAQVLTQAPRQPEIMLILGREAFNASDFDLALKAFKFALNSATANGKASAQHWLDKTEQAINGR